MITRDEAKLLRLKLERLSQNLWWAWHPEVIQVFRQLDPDLWRRCDHNPVAMLRSMSDALIIERSHDLELNARIEGAYRSLETYLTDTRTWAIAHAGALLARPVAYFSAEFGLHESLPLYSGGLGVLAGDHIKSASDLGLPLVGVSLLYREGYFRQWIDRSGYQRETYANFDSAVQPVREAIGKDGRKVTIEVPVGSNGSVIRARVWRVDVGRASLVLLDPHVPENDERDRAVGTRLYGGDRETRIRQEILLGVGGVIALKALGIVPGVVHLNEGHSAFAVLELARQRMHEDGMSFADAMREVRQKVVFTTHTPVEAGHDRFEPDQVEAHLVGLRESLGLSREGFMSLGRVNPQDAGEPFCMTVLALKCATKSNGVSALHGRVTRRMWHSLWPHHGEQEVPIGHVTNGVHVPTWLAPEMRVLYDRHLRANWPVHLAHPETWMGIDEVPDIELWGTLQILKSKLVRFVRRRLVQQGEHADGLDPDVATMVADAFDPNVLTIGFARRFAQYKRATLILRDRERLKRILTNSSRPVQIIFAGKAHPHDEIGKGLIREIRHAMSDPAFQGRLAFIDDFDINVARHLVQGVDVWLNTPTRPLEASGTSGQKVLLNGGRNFSILDGWFPEGYDGQNGFAIGSGEVHVSSQVQEERDAADLMRVLEEEIVPLFYERDSWGLPVRWLARVKRAVRTLGWRFNTDRMVMDYVTHCYLPAAGAWSCEVDPH
ncbi:MAG: alpha-glucan family phosphorylase [Deltaproteobacteria bacterium]|nr:alpha-glucan family phosphorylase [Deltaproteobacteria bacterium]